MQRKFAVIYEMTKFYAAAFPYHIHSKLKCYYNSFARGYLGKNPNLAATGFAFLFYYTINVFE